MEGYHGFNFDGMPDFTKPQDSRMQFPYPAVSNDLTMNTTNVDQNFFDLSQAMFEIGPGEDHQPQGMVDLDMSSKPPGSNAQPLDFDIGAPYTGLGPGPPSAQNEIVSNQKARASQMFGQVTPPDDELGPYPPSHGNKRKQEAQEEEEAARLNPEQRARNAANKRHSKPKPGRKKIKGSKETEKEPESDESPKDFRIQIYREKNRKAAAKCRAKTRGQTDILQSNHREAAAANDYLKREARELRNELTYLRSCALEHRLGACTCEHMHKYNVRQAQQIARVVGRGSIASLPSSSAVGGEGMATTSSGSDDASPTTAADGGLASRSGKAGSSQARLVALS